MGLADYPPRCLGCYRSMLSTTNVAFSGYRERLITHALSAGGLHIGSLSNTQSNATRARLRPMGYCGGYLSRLRLQMCYGSYRGRLRAFKLFLWLHGSAEYIKMGLWWLERLKTQKLF